MMQTQELVEKIDSDIVDALAELKLLSEKAINIKTRISNLKNEIIDLLSDLQPYRES